MKIYKPVVYKPLNELEFIEFSDVCVFRSYLFRELRLRIMENNFFIKFAIFFKHYIVIII